MENKSEGLKIRSPGKEVQEKMEKDWMKEFGLRKCCVKLHNFVNYLPDIID